MSTNMRAPCITLRRATSSLVRVQSPSSARRGATLGATRGPRSRIWYASLRAEGFPKKGLSAAAPLCRRTQETQKRPVTCQAATGAANLICSTAVASGASLQSMVAVVMGYMIIAGACVLKVPQIHRIVTKRSVEGLSPMAVAVETLVCTIVVAYNLNSGHALNTYGELVMCCIQNLIIGYLICYYKGIGALKTGAVAVSGAILQWWLVSGTCGMQVLKFAQASTVVLMTCGSSIPQIWMNYRRGGTGELSLITYFLQFAGNMTRVFTTLTLTGDKLMLFSAAVTGFCTLIIVIQIAQTALRERALLKENEESVNVLS